MSKTKHEFNTTTLVMIIVSSAIYAFGIDTFVKSGNLFPGGFAGISRLISEITIQFTNVPISFSFVYFTLNTITTIVVWKKIGHKFIKLSILWYTLTSLFTALFVQIPITQDPLLVAVFGGLLNGVAIGIALQNNASSGGFDFIAIVFSMKYNMPMWRYVMMANAMILVIAGLIFGWNDALYSIIFQFVSTQVVSTMHQRYKLTRVEVVTNQPEEICSQVFHTVRHGITKVPCEGGFTHQSRWLLLMTINTYQLKEVIQAIKGVDPCAFVTVSSVEKIIGNYYQKPLD